ncbi:hypothetical protein P43SY_009711 [Pythium insidiosum]|uniref:Uncharacterized protein n=1 Tax=Pythium insidiosum TaxID=114742 RepID=A0AAD5Q9S3_PYTIN|nr:hypothetical protein P43SY_009711 [Pythium insidiosum]
MIGDQKTPDPVSPEVEFSNQEDLDTDENYEDAFVYPSNAHLELEWKSDMLVFGDRLCLIRESDDIEDEVNTTLTVFPGLNSVHTSFGTTPLIDVKPLSATLQVFPESDRAMVAAASRNRDGFRDEKYLKSISLEQELEVVRTQRKVFGLQMIEEDLSAQRLYALEREVMEREREENERAEKAKQGENSAGADLLRSTILGKLQGNDIQQVEMARATMERELVEVEDFFNARLSFKSIKKIIWRKIKPYVTCGAGSAALTQSDSYQAATGATDNSFVWDECMNAYLNAPKIAKENFTYIIRDMLDEIGARKHQLGLKTQDDDTPEGDTVSEKKNTPKKKDKLAHANKLLRLGLEIMVPTTRVQVVTDNGEEVVMGEVVARLGHRFRQGGFFVAKYIRRSGSVNPTLTGNDPSIVTAGEICRYGPFFVEPELFSYSPRQVAFAVWKVVWKILVSEEGTLVMKVMSQFYVGLLKYFLAVVSLSFNISVLAGNFDIKTENIKAVIDSFQSRLARYFGPIKYVMARIDNFFGSFVDDLLSKLDMFTIAGECMTGFVLYAVLAMLFAATFVVYIVVQEDLLLKVQKIHTILPFNPGKAVLAFIEQIGALLVIPLYLSIKSCVLFIAGNWSRVYHQLNDDPSNALKAFGLYTKATSQCTNAEFARINYGFGIGGIVLITMFLFVFLPLLLLDLFSWVPLSELEEPKKLKKFAHSFDRNDIKAAVHSNADLVEVRKYCPKQVIPGPCFGSFKRHYDDYTSMAFRDLLKKYGGLGLFGIFINIYAHLMFQSIWRSLGVLLGWRLRGPYMYRNALQSPRSRWKIFDVFCFRFNMAWKIQFIQDKMIMPFVNITMVTFGLWGETQWKEFNVEERANECYRMEPSGEVKQLQMMTLHGKIVSLFWLCIPETQVLAYLAEVLNRGPVLGYFLNKQFLQADIPESEREKDPVWLLGEDRKIELGDDDDNEEELDDAIEDALFDDDNEEELDDAIEDALFDDDNEEELADAIEDALDDDDNEDGEDGEDEDEKDDTKVAALVAAAGILATNKKQLILLNAMPLDKDAEPFGWDPKNDDTEDAERELIIRQAKSLRDISEREVSKFAKKSIQNVPDAEREERLGQHREQLQRADTMMKTMMHSPKLKPYKKKITDILEEEVQENRLHLTSPRTSRMYSKAAAALEEAAKKMRKVISGQAKFRPANNCVPEDDPNFETFIYGNDAGIYQSKYGLHEYEFCYLSEKPEAAKVAPAETANKLYEILERFVSNPIQIGTFNIFMNLTCDQPLIGAREQLNLSWIIYGVSYSILSNPKIRNCVGFYKIDNANNVVCSRIEIVPPSAYLQSDDNEPCPGRMLVTAPRDPGVYEIRFLFNFFKKAQLHRQCQVFGDLEDEMQQLRIRSFYEKRAVTEELRRFALKEPKMWGIARMNTFVWLKSMLISTLREPVKSSVMESTTEYSEFLIGRLKKKLQQGLESPSRVFQRRISNMVAPLKLNGFMDVLMVALQSNSQMMDQLASITFISPTDEDEKKRGLNAARDSLLLPSDRDLLVFGAMAFRPMAMNYLNQSSLCGYHDFVDDIILNHGQMMQTKDQVMNNLSSSCVALYESAIIAAIDAMMQDAKVLNLANALQNVDVMLADLCRNHLQNVIRALLETDCRTGRRWPGQPEGSYERIAALRIGNVPPDPDDVQSNQEDDVQIPGGLCPITREHIALRRWIRPKLERKIVTILKQRHARLMSGYMPIIQQLLVSCLRPGLSLAGSPFPNHRSMKTASPLYFLEESRGGGVQGEGAANDAAFMDVETQEADALDQAEAEQEAEEEEDKEDNEDEEDDVGDEEIDGDQ